MTNKLYIRGLLHGVTHDQLADHFKKAGHVTSAKVIMDRDTGLTKGFGFVEMGTEDEAKKAIAELNNTSIDGGNITVKAANPQ